MVFGNERKNSHTFSLVKKHFYFSSLQHFWAEKVLGKKSNEKEQKREEKMVYAT